MMIADINLLNLNVTIVTTRPGTVTMQRPSRLHRQLLQSLRRRHGRFETGQASCDRARSASEVLSGASPGLHPPRLTCRHPSHRIFLDRFEAEVGPAAGSVRAYVSAGCLV